ncbi:2-oxo acid dehydrogenase subunit E2 [Dactylosporangium sp. NPDC051485]|uniref:2-oxo acid dehydrogenase subunit E2 n=1 Tax=Dactylosporangium sp. NPDC051485 TaxID=3154846 RepID=UPI003424ECD7
MSSQARMAEALNATLHDMFAAHRRLVLLGEDIADPSGGAFGVTRGLSTRYPDRVLSTPISEGGIVGVAGGLALCGDQVIVEVMFGDFLTLCVDPIVNFISKSVSMYGRRNPMRVVVRCPVGGNRGYGPTHSQSLQKHLLGVPHLRLYELSQLHDPRAAYEEVFSAGEPAVFFEDKILYTRPVLRQERVDDVFRVSPVDPAGNWMRVRPGGAGAPQRLVIAPGGLVPRTLKAMRDALHDKGIVSELLVPLRLFPLDLDPVLPMLAQAPEVIVAEDSVAGGGWGSDLARLAYERLWGRLRAPIRLLQPPCEVIPAAMHLERALLIQDATIYASLTEAPSMGELVVPTLNANDDSYVLLEWLVPDGSEVSAGDSVATIETSKAVTDLVVEESGRLSWLLPPGSVLHPGDVVGRVTTTAAAAVGDAGPSPAAAARRERPAGGEQASPAVGADAPGGRIQLSAHQRAVARAVSRSHATIPAAFVLVKVSATAVRHYLNTISESAQASIGLPEVVVKTVAGRREAFPDLFATLYEENLTLERFDHADIGVTVDVGHGLYVPVIRAAENRSVHEIATELMRLRVRAARGTMLESDLGAAALTLSLHTDLGVVTAQPIVYPGQICALSLGATQQELRLTADQQVETHEFFYLGLTYDHRVVNGRQAARFLTVLRDDLESVSAAEKGSS